MGTGKTDIYVYAHWAGMPEAQRIGILGAHQAKGKKAFSFEYDLTWLKTKAQFLLDPDINWYSGPQYPNQKENFGVFFDSMPDTWGRTLMKRRAAQAAKEKAERPPKLYDVDFLLGVFDPSRIGALRFKTDPEGPFLDDDAEHATPPWSSIRELQYGAQQLEEDPDPASAQKWLNLLMAPGSSLGGARPKANILDDHGHPWIAKFPSKNDPIDKGLWEYLTYRLAEMAGIAMAESKVEKVLGHQHTFFTKRFDRMNGERVHFASAMTMTGHNEETLKNHEPSYLELAEFIQFTGSQNVVDLQQLWRRIIFNICVSNTDDHLRNHGFLLTEKGWILSPAYDLNPSVDKDGLSLQINETDNALDFDLAREVGVYFEMLPQQMDACIAEVSAAVNQWERVADELGIRRSEKELMAPAFHTLAV